MENMCMGKTDFIIPEEIIRAYDNNKLVIFVGAGISRLVGCKSWKDLAEKLIVKTYDNYSEKKQILSAGLDNKQLITIAHSRAVQNNVEDVFWAELKDALKPCEKIMSEDNVYKALSRLNTFFVTTNADGIMERYFPKGRWSCELDINYFKSSNTPCIFYLHGRYVDETKEERENLIFTVDRYLKAYTDGNRLSFLNHIFSNFTVLFIGYGMSEFEILDNLFVKADSSSNRSIQHYILEGFCKSENALKDAKMNYYKELGVELIPYDMEEKGYEAVIDYVSCLVEELSMKTRGSFNNIATLKGLISEYNDDNFSFIEYLLDRNRNTKREAYFIVLFQEILLSKDYYKWLHNLWEKQIISVQDFSGENFEKGCWGYIQCLESCIDKHKLDEELLDLTARIIKEIYNEVSENSGNDRNEINLLHSLSRVSIKLTEKHADEMTVSIIEKYYRFDPFFVVSLIADNVDNWEKWPTKLACSIIDMYIFKGLKESVSLSSAEYWTWKTCKVVIDKLNVEIKEYLITESIEELFKLQFNTFTEKKFIQHFSQFSSKRGNALFKVIEEGLDSIDQNNRERIIEKVIEHANTEIQVQFSFYFSKKCNIDKSILINKFNPNPLCHRNTEADVYGYFKEQLDKHIAFNEAELNTIFDWIDKADFGFDVNIYENEDDKEEIRLRICRSKQQFWLLFKDSDGKFVHEFDEITKIIGKPSGKTPVENADEYSPKIRRFSEEKMFIDEEINNINSANQLVTLVNNKIKNSGNNYLFNCENYIHKQAIEIAVDNNFLDEYLNLMGTVDINTFVNVLHALKSADRKKTYFNEHTIKILDNTCKKLYSEKDCKLKEKCLTSIIDIIFIMQEQGICVRELLELQISLEYDKIFDIKNEIELERIHYRLLIDNCTEFFVLIIQTACMSNSKDVMKTVEEFIECKLLDNKYSKRTSLAIAHELHNMFVFNFEWINSNLDRIYDAVGNLRYYWIGTACSNLSTINTEFVNFLLIDNRAESALEQFKLIEDNDRQLYRNSIIGYMLSAFMYGYIDDKQYGSLLLKLDNDDYHNLFNTITGGWIDDIKHPVEETVQYTLQTIKNQNASNHLFETVCDSMHNVEKPSKTTWNIIKQCIDGISNESNLSWFAIDCLIENGAEFCEEIIDVVKTGINKLHYPKLETLLNVFDMLKRDNKTDTIKVIANMVITKGLYVNEMEEYVNSNC